MQQEGADICISEIHYGEGVLVARRLTQHVWAYCLYKPLTLKETLKLFTEGGRENHLRSSPLPAPPAPWEGG